MNPNDNLQNPATPQTPDLSPDQINQQYQDILNKYAEDIKKTSEPQVNPAPQPPVEEVAQITSVEPEQINIEPTPVNTTPSEPSVMDEVLATSAPTLSTTELQLPQESTPEPASPVVVIPPAEAPPQPQSAQVVTPPPVLTPPPTAPAFVIDEPSKLAPPPKSSNIFKYIFFLSFLIFLGVCGAISYTLFFTPPSSAPKSPENPTVSVTPSPDVTGSCQLNDKSYEVGESFPSADGCNTCSCSEDLTIACTEMACDASPSAKSTVTPTKSTSTSAVPKDWKKYQNKVFNVSFSYPGSFSIIDTLPKAYTKMTTANQYIELSDIKNKIKLIVSVNTDGLGPFFPNKTYELSNTSGSLAVINEKTETVDDVNADPNNLEIDTSVVKGREISLSMRYMYPKDDSSSEGVFKQIISTFKIL